MTTTAPPLAIEAHGLVRTFGTTRAVDGLDLEVPAGTVYGVLGPNGAGKTTAIRMLATLLRPDAGSARVFGHDIVADADEVRARVSLTGQYASIDEELTGTENLVLLGRLLGHTRREARARAEQLLHAFGLTDAGDRQVKTYSGGMRRRADIAASIVATPQLIFLDEPTTGLDPRSRNRVWDIVRALIEQGTTVLLTTQYLDEADQLADRIAVIDHGRVVAEGTPGALKSSTGAGALDVRLADPARRDEAGRVLADHLAIEVQRSADPAALSARVADPARATAALDALHRAGVEVTTFALGQPSLDEVFLTLTGTTTNGASRDNATPNGAGGTPATNGAGRTPATNGAGRTPVTNGAAAPTIAKERT